MVASQCEQDDAVLRSSFHHLDVNGDGFLTTDEILKTLTNNEESLHRVGKVTGFQKELQAFINKNDTDGNKKLDDVEFIEAMKKFSVQEISTDEE